MARQLIKIDRDKVRAAMAAPEEYAGRITTLLETHYNYGRDKMLSVALRTAAPNQRKALAEFNNRRASRQRGGTKQ
jgi:hypothetical protein